MASEGHLSHLSRKGIRKDGLGTLRKSLLLRTTRHLMKMVMIMVVGMRNGRPYMAAIGLASLGMM
jgi:hypothetical protein